MIVATSVTIGQTWRHKRTGRRLIIVQHLDVTRSVIIYSDTHERHELADEVIMSEFELVAEGK